MGKVGKAVTVGTVVGEFDQPRLGLANDLAIANIPTSADPNVSACSDALWDETDV